MKTAKGSLSDLIVSSFGCEIDDEQFETVFAHTMSYLTRGISYAVYQERLKPFCRGESFSAKDFRLRLHSTEYFSLVIRLYMLRLGKTRSLTQDQARAYAAEYGVGSRDAKRMYRFWKCQPRFRTRVRAEAAKYAVDAHLNLKVLRQVLAAVMVPLSTHIKRYAYKKLRFIARSQNLEMADLHAELTVKAMAAFYKTMPCLFEPAHVLNYLRRAVSNAGTNIIYANTSLKAGRLVNNDPTAEKRDSFTMLVVSENQMRLTSEGEAVGLDDIAGHNPMERVELEHSVTTLVSKVKAGGKKHKFLTILMGADDDQFTEWLRTNRYCSAAETNSDYQLRVDPVRFNMMLGRFLNVRPGQVETFITKLRDSLDPVYAEAA